MADDVLRYSDLIAPDNSIEDLIRLLDKVQGEYSALTQAARQYATNLQADMRRVNTTTRAGRDELARLTTQADTLDDVIRGLGDGYRLVERELAGMRAETPKATRNIEALTDQVQRYNDIIRGLRNMRDIFGGPMTQGLDRDFLRGLRELENVVSDAWPALNEYAKSIRETLLELKRVQGALDFNATGRAASDSLAGLEQALDSVIASYKTLNAEERGGEIGGVTKSNLEVLRDAVTKLNAEIEPLVDKTTKLIEAQQGLEVAMSDEGKRAVALKQKIAELNKETALQATIVEELSDSRKALRAQLALAENEFDKLSGAEQNSAAGVALQDRIKNLKTVIAEMTAKLKPAKAELTALEQAQQSLAKATKALDVALTDEGKQAIAARQALSELTKETKLQAKEASSADGSYDQLKAKLQQAVIAYRAMSKAERENTVEGQALEAQIVSLRNQLKGLDDRTKAASASMTESQRITKLTADVTEKLAQAKAKARVAASNEYKELLKLSEAQREANRIAKLQAAVDKDGIDSYNGMAAQYELNKIKLRKLAMANRELTEEEKRLVAETYTLRTEMKKFQEMTGVHTLSVGDYGKAWDSFGFSIQQIVREMPAAAQGINNLFIAISNNIPIFVDELMKLRKENAAFIEQNQPEKVVNIGKRIATSLFSWQTALMALLAVLTMHGDKVAKWIKSMAGVTKSAISLAKALKNVNKELESSNDSYGENVVTFNKLREEFNSLGTEAEKVAWIEKYKNEIEQLGYSINSVVEAEQLFNENSANVIEAFKLRAQSAAAQKLAADKYVEALQAEFEIRGMQPDIDKAQKALDDKVKELEDYYRNTEKGRRAINLLAAADTSLGSNFETALAAQIKGQTGREQQALDKLLRGKNYQESIRDAAEADAKTYEEIMNGALTDARNKMGGFSFGGREKEGLDLTDRIYRARLQAIKKYEESETELIKNEFDKRKEKLEASARAEIAALEEVNRKAYDWMSNPKYKELTEEQKQMARNTIEANNFTILNLEEKLADDLHQLELDRQINTVKIEKETNDLKLQVVKKGSDQEYDLRKKAIKKQRDLAILENKKLKGTGKEKDESAIKSAYNQQLVDVDNEKKINRANKDIEDLELQLQAEKKGADEEYNLRKQILEKKRDLEIEQNKLLAKELQKSEEDIKASYQKQIDDVTNEQKISAQKQVIADMNAQLEAGINKQNILLEKGKQHELDAQLALLDEEEKLAKMENRMLAENLQVQEDLITKSYQRRRNAMNAQYILDDFAAKQAAERATITSGVTHKLSWNRTDEEKETVKARKAAKKDEGFGTWTTPKTGTLSEYQLEVFDLNQKLDLLNEKQRLFNTNLLELSPAEVAQLNQELADTKNQLDELTGFDGFMKMVGDKGIGGGILTKLGFDDESIEAMQNAGNIIIEQIGAIADAYVEAAEREVEAAKERVAAAQSAYDAEIEARNNGYANNVATAKAELQLEKRTQREKQKELEKAQKAQEAINTVTQISSLVTATAQLWASFASTGVAAPILAAAAITAMWGSFAFAKIKAAQIAKKSDTYGEGGLEFLQGGSHASGNDIDLGVTNSRGNRMRAEGGEAMAIINKKNTRKYKSILPGLIDSLNNGNFEDKYLSSLNTSGVVLSINNTGVDLSKIESSVDDIKRQNETRYYSQDGYLIIQHKNVRRIIKN